jgi:hypothetical protein
MENCNTVASELILVNSQNEAHQISLASESARIAGGAV